MSLSPEEEVTPEQGSGVTEEAAEGTTAAAAPEVAAAVFGPQTFRVGVKIAAGDYVPAGTTGASSAPPLTSTHPPARR